MPDVQKAAAAVKTHRNKIWNGSQNLFMQFKLTELADPSLTHYLCAIIRSQLRGTENRTFKLDVFIVMCFCFLQPALL